MVGFSARRAAMTGVTLLIAACGAKTGLRVPDGSPPVDASRDLGIDMSVCATATYDLTRSPADVVFVIDRSGSMAWSIDGRGGVPVRDQRWTLLGTALDQALLTLGPSVRVGGKFFPDEIPESTADVTPMIGCRVSAGIDLLPMTAGRASLLRVFQTTQPRGGTPTARAVAEARDALLATTRDGSQRVIVLATDGGPNCNPSPGVDHDVCVCTSAPVDCASPTRGVYQCLDDTRTIGTIRSAYDRGIPVYVVGIEDPNRTDLSDVLDRMAVAGGRARNISGERRFYNVRSADALRGALEEISSAITSCTYQVPRVPTPSETVRITVGDRMLIEGVDFSWGNEALGEVVLTGTACESSRVSGTSVRVQLSCADAGR